MNSKIKIILLIILTILIFFFGFYFGRKNVSGDKPDIEYVYIEGERVIDSIQYPVPYDVIIPPDTADIIRGCVRDGIYTELFPEKVITEYIEVTYEDTLAIIKDWGVKRLYSEKLFEVDTIGSCLVNATVQYNRLLNLSYDYIGVTKVVTITDYRVKLFSPYIGGGFLLDNDFSNYINIIPSVNAGFFIKEKYGIQMQYGKMLKNNNNLYGISFLYKF